MDSVQWTWTHFYNLLLLYFSYFILWSCWSFYSPVTHKFYIPVLCTWQEIIYVIKVIKNDAMQFRIVKYTLSYPYMFIKYPEAQRNTKCNLYAIFWETVAQTSQKSKIHLIISYVRRNDILLCNFVLQFIRFIALLRNTTHILYLYLDYSGIYNNYYEIYCSYALYVAFTTAVVVSLYAFHVR